jgi:hypothetical protein
VSRDNLGARASLVAGASLLVDYLLTAAVSVSSGAAAVLSIPTFHDAEVEPAQWCAWRGCCGRSGEAAWAGP